MAKKLSKTERTKRLIAKHKGTKSPRAIMGMLRRQLDMTEQGAHSYYYTNVNKV